MYSLDRGRPAYPAVVMFKMLFIQRMYDLSDRMVCEECRYNILYRRFLGLKLEDGTPDFSTLCVFRNKLGLERVKRMFKRVLEQVEGLGIGLKGLRVVDATWIDGDVEQCRGSRILRKMRTRLVKMVKEEGIEIEGIEEYIGGEWIASERLAYVEEKVKTEDLLRKLECSGQISDGRIKTLMEVLREVVEGARKVEELSSDKDARKGYTGEERKGKIGYKVHVSSTEDEIITNIDVMSGDENEGKHLQEIIGEELEEGRRINVVTGDSAYDSYENRRFLEDRCIDGVIPRKKRNLIEKGGFIYNPETEELVCPGGKNARGKVKGKNGQTFYMCKDDCRRCGYRCKVADKSGYVRVFVGEDYKMYIKVRGRLGGKWKKILDIRFGAEKVMGWLKRKYKFRRAKYRGRDKVHIQALLIAIVNNLTRAVGLLYGAFT
jgi:transposase